MIPPAPMIYGSLLLALGCWGAFATSRTLTGRGGWSRHRILVLAGAAFTASCLLPGAAMIAGAFSPWMLIPLGVCYAVLLPLPCSFAWANRGRMRKARACLFIVLSAALVGAGIGWLPIEWFGL